MLVGVLAGDLADVSGFILVFWTIVGEPFYLAEIPFWVRISAFVEVSKSANSLIELYP